MKKIMHFYLPGMRELHLSLHFFDNVYECIKMIEDSRFQPVLQLYRTAMAEYRDAAKPSSNNLLTMQIAAEDECRDSLRHFIRERTDELLAHDDDHFRETGGKIDGILASHKVHNGMTADEKTKWIDALTTELWEKIDPVELLLTGMAECLTELNRANWSFSELSKARNDEIEGRILTSAIMTSRKEMNRAYQEAADFINAMALYNGEADYAGVIDRVNLLVREAAMQTADAN
ncbi:MAG: DUF6261 family protein [Tannerellaceae bacterium]|jgi:hypothetical protein|nr:DUF6261 family protein [Tannerellaceae bacterium]